MGGGGGVEGGGGGGGGCGYRGLAHWTRIKAVEEAPFIPGASVTGVKGAGAGSGGSAG